MTLATIIDNVTEWVQTAICDGIRLKLPDDDRNDESYPGGFVTPTAFPMFVPAKDRLPPRVAAPIPSICIQFKEGKDTLVEGKRVLHLRLSLATWSPGTHGSEVYEPNPSGTGLIRHTGPEAAEAYNRNMDGWRGVFNLVDRALSKLESTEYIAGLRLVKEGDGISYGSFTEEGQLWDLYPYWFLWIDVALECGANHKDPEIYANFL